MDDFERKVLEAEEPAPPNNLPTWDECAIRVDNSDFITRRVADGGYGPDADTLLATELHRFIYEYDDADPYRSAWFMHRLELMLAEHSRAIRELVVEECATLAEDATAYTQFQTVEHYKIAHYIAAAIRALTKGEE